TIDRVVIAETGTTDNSTRRSLDRDERQTGSTLLQLEGGCHIVAHLIGRANHGDGVTPDLEIEPDFAERRVMLRNHGLEPHEASLEHHRLEVGWRDYHSASCVRRRRRSQRHDGMLEMKTCRILVRPRNGEVLRLHEYPAE